eukprot:scaffold9212_cov59-Phaeocystis_antarctica.AAC.2
MAAFDGVVARFELVAQAALERHAVQLDDQVERLECAQRVARLARDYVAVVERQAEAAVRQALDPAPGARRGAALLELSPRERGEGGAER